MAIDDQNNLEEIRNARLHRLRLLEKRQAVEGFRTPPEVITEIVQTRAELGIVESAIAHPANVETAEQMGAGGRWLATDRKLDQIEERNDERMSRFEQAIERRLDRMEEHSAARYQAQEAKHDNGAQLYRFLFTVLTLGVILSLVLVAFLIGGAFK